MKTYLILEFSVQKDYHLKPIQRNIYFIHSYAKFRREILFLILMKTPFKSNPKKAMEPSPGDPTLAQKRKITRTEDSTNVKLLASHSTNPQNPDQTA